MEKKSREKKKCLRVLKYVLVNTAQTTSGIWNSRHKLSATVLMFYFIINSFYPVDCVFNTPFIGTFSCSCYSMHTFPLTVKGFSRRIAIIFDSNSSGDLMVFFFRNKITPSEIFIINLHFIYKRKYI